MKKGAFYGLGLGPGDPELITLKALNVLRRADRIFAAASRSGGRSVAAGILAAWPELTAPLCELEFTMSNDRNERQRKIDEHAKTIHAELERGLDCAFVTLGDPMTYSTCSHLVRALRLLAADTAVEIVPGVNSWSALAARSGEALCEDRQELRIVPSHQLEAGQMVEFPARTTTVLLKTYRSRHRLLEQLPPESNFLYGANLGLPDEFCSGDADEIAGRPDAYLSMLIVKK